MSAESIPADILVQVDLRLIQNDEILQHGILLIGEEDAAKDLQLTGVAIQRGTYELLQVLWAQYLKQQLKSTDLH